MNIDKRFIENLRDRISIVDCISKYIPLTRKGKEYWGCCPFHNEKTASFSVVEDKSFYHHLGFDIPRIGKALFTNFLNISYNIFLLNTLVKRRLLLYNLKRIMGPALPS